MSEIYDRRVLVPYFTIIITVAVLLRTIFTGPVEMGGDALKKWAWAQDIAKGIPASDLLANHHTARWGINLPTTLLVKLVGPQWFTYYLVPIVFFGLFLIATAYFITKWSKTPLLIFAVFVLLLFGEPMYFRSTSQIEPFIFSATYMMCHAIFLGRITKTPTQWNHFFAALFIFFAYGAKETAVYYVPATSVFLIASLGWRQGARSLVKIGAYGIALVAVETVFFSVSYGEFTTRLTLVGHHFEILEGKMTKDLGEMSLSVMLMRWIQLPLYTTLLLVAGLLSTIWFFVRGLRTGRITAELLPSLFFVSFAFFCTFAIKSLDPLVPLEPPKDKYLAEIVPWACLAVAFSMGYVVDAAKSLLARRVAMGGIAVVAAAACVLSIATPRQYGYGARYPLAAAWMWHADRTLGLVRELVKSGMPIRFARRDFMPEVLSVKVAPLDGTVEKDIFVARAFREAYQHRSLPLSCANLTVELDLTYSQCPAKAQDPQ